MKDILTFNLPYCPVVMTPTTFDVTLWNADTGKKDWEEKAWGDTGALAHQAYLHVQRMDIRALTTLQEKVVWPYMVRKESMMPFHTVGASMGPASDTVIISRVPLLDVDLARILPNAGVNYGGVMVGTQGSGIDSEHIVYWDHTEYDDNASTFSVINYVERNQRMGGAYSPLASESLWVYRIIYVSCAVMAAQNAFFPSVRLSMNCEVDRPDTIPYLARRALSVRTN